MKIVSGITLTQRIVGLILLWLAITAWAIMWRSEGVIEDVLLDQAKRQAQVFLLGLEAEAQSLADPIQDKDLQSLVDRTLRRNLDDLGFSIFSLYAFDRQGRIMAHSVPGEHADKGMEDIYKAIFADGRPYLGDVEESDTDRTTGHVIHKADIIIPLHHAGSVVALLEVEINLSATMERIRHIDDERESQMLRVIVVNVLLVLAFVWWVVNRWLIRPIRDFARVTRDIAGGELSARTGIVQADEVGELGQSINGMADSIEHLFTEQEQAHLQMLQSLAKALEAKDAYTAGHSGRVSRFSVQLGRRLGLSESELKLLKQGALVHDVGKIGISDSILNKASPLDDHEYEIMKKHPELTASIMRPLKRFKAFAEIAAWHHERWDGNGYPDGLQGEQIPLLARIVSIADTWDAMTGDRVYRKGMSIDTALSILKREQHDGQWDPALLASFIEMIEDDQAVRHEVEGDMFGVPVTGEA